MEILAHTNGDLHFQKVALFVKIKWMFGDILAKKKIYWWDGNDSDEPEASGWLTRSKNLLWIVKYLPSSRYLLYFHA